MGVLRPGFSFIKKESRTLVLSCEFCEISKSSIFTEQLGKNVSGLLFENIQNVKCALYISSKVFFQDCGIIFPTKRVDVTSKFLLAKLYQYLENITKNNVPQGKTTSFKFSVALKLGSKQRKLYKGMHL